MKYRQILIPLFSRFFKIYSKSKFCANCLCKYSHKPCGTHCTYVVKLFYILVNKTEICQFKNNSYVSHHQTTRIKKGLRGIIL